MSGNVGDLVVGLGMDSSGFRNTLVQAKALAKDGGAEIGKSLKEGYRLANTGGSGAELTPFGPRGAGWGAGMAGYDLRSSVTGLESAAMRQAQADRKRMFDEQMARHAEEQRLNEAAMQQQQLQRRMGEITARANFLKMIESERATMRTPVGLGGVAAYQTMMGIGGSVAGQNMGGGASNALGRSIGQIGFAIQDFTSVLAMGGKGALERALMSTMNNVQMLGAVFGGWGLAITAVGGAIGSMLIPKLLEGKGAFEDLGESVETILKGFERFGERMADLHLFGAEAGKMDSEKELKDSREKLRLDRESAEIKAKAATDAAAEIEKRIADTARTREKILPKLHDVTWEAFGWAFSPAKSFTAWGLDKEIDKMKESHDKAIDLAMKHSTEMRAIDEKGRLLDTSEKDILRRETEEKNRKADEDETKERMRRNEREVEQNERMAERFRKNAQSPLDATKEQLGEIERLWNEGFFGADREAAAGAMSGVIADFKTKVPNMANNAVAGGEFGTASGFSDVMKSIRQSTTSPELEVAKESKAILERILAAFRAGLKLDPPIRTESL